MGGEADFVSRGLDAARRRQNEPVGSHVEVGEPAPLRGERIDLRRQASAFAVSKDNTIAPDDLCRRLDQHAGLMEAINRLIRFNAAPKLLQRHLGMLHQPFVPRRGEVALRGRRTINDVWTLTGHSGQTTGHAAPAREQFEHLGITVAATDFQLGTLAVEVRDDRGEGSRRRPDGRHLTTDACGDVRCRRGQCLRAEWVRRDDGEHWIHHRVPPGHPSRHGCCLVDRRERIIALRVRACHEGSVATIEGFCTPQQPHP